MRLSLMIIFFMTLFLWDTARLLAGPNSLSPVLPLAQPWDPKTYSQILHSDIEGANGKNGRSDFAEFQTSFNNVSKRNNVSEQDKDILTIKRLAGKFGPKVKLKSELTMARVLSGLSGDGRKLKAPSGAWRNHLLAACNIAAKIDEKTHESTVLQAIVIWRKVEGTNASWTLPPVDIKAQRQFSMFKAIIERQALVEWSNGNTTSAIKKYRALSTSFNTTPEGANLDQRLIDLEHMIYSKDEKPAPYQRILLEMDHKYADQGPNDSSGNKVTKSTQLLTYIRSQHKALIDALINRALLKQATTEQRKAALLIIEKYIDVTANITEKQRARNAMGDIQYADGDHRSATGTFAALAVDVKPENATAYWRKAIRSQIVLANWTPEAPWSDNTTKGDTGARSTLLDMYRKVDHVNAQSWTDASHIGLLLVAISRQDDAIKFWIDRITKFPQNREANKAIGWMEERYIAEKRWLDLEPIARLAIQLNLAGLYKQKSNRPRDMLGLALIESGLQLYAASDFKHSVAKLDEFVKGWKSDPRHDLAYYTLALAYHSNRQNRLSIQTLEDFLKAHGKSKWRHDALAYGGQWSQELAWDDHVIYFLETFASEFPNDGETSSTLTNLTDLYLGREYYDAANRTMLVLLAKKNLDYDSKVAIAKRALSNMERHGSLEKSQSIANKLLTTYKFDPLFSAMAVEIAAKIAARDNRKSVLAAIAKKSQSLDSATPRIAEIKAEIMFLLANNDAKNTFKDEVYSLSVKDPQKQLEVGYALYLKINDEFKHVCDGNTSSWCGAALFKAARFGEDFVKAYADLDISKTLDPTDVNNFKTRKESILSSVDSACLKQDEESLEQARSGLTTPMWTSSILWQNGSEWTSEKLSGENSSAYIQLRTR